MRIIQATTYIVLIFVLMPYAYALKTGVVVDVDGDIYKGCVLTEKGNSAYDVLKKFDDVNDDIKMKFDGVITNTPFLRSINGIEGKALGDNKFSGWNFWISDKDDNFKEPPELAPGWGMGIGDYKVENEIDVIGVNFAITEFNPDWTVKVKPQKPEYIRHSELCEKLKVKDIKVYVDGKKEAGADKDGGKIDVIPGSKVELKVKLENLYTYEENINIEEISVEGTLEDIDDGNDLDDGVDEFDLKPEKKKEVTLKFDIPLEMEDGDYDLIIEIKGENEIGFPYSDTIEFEVEVDKEKHDVVFNQLKFLEGNVQCGSSANLKVKVINFGTNDENVKLTISNHELGINIQESFGLNKDPFKEDNSFSKSYSIKLPANINPGTYTLFADLFYGDSIKSATVKLNVKCNGLNNVNNKSSKEIKSAVNNPTQSKNNNPLSTIETMPAKIVGAATSTVTEEKKSSNKDILMAGVFVGEIMLLIVGVILLAYLLKKH